MSVIIGFKFVHYLALFLAGGLGVANGLLAKAHDMLATTGTSRSTDMMKLARLDWLQLFFYGSVALVLVI